MEKPKYSFHVMKRDMLQYTLLMKNRIFDKNMVFIIEIV
jgi:hypothetical protein